jgi:membrane protein DedA with SNARE-associated domain
LGALLAAVASVPDFASVTDSLVTFATHVIKDLGLAGVGLLTLSSATIAVPGSEATMLFAGFNVFQGHLSLVGIIIFGLLGDILGATIAYTIGFLGERELVERHGSKIHLSARKLDVAHSWFERRGAASVFVSRFIPFVRLAFPYAAGVARMRFSVFLAAATLGSIPWIIGLGVLGREVGKNWQNWRHHLEYVDYVGAAILVLGIAYLIVRRFRGRGDAAPADAATDVVAD